MAVISLLGIAGIAYMIKIDLWHTNPILFWGISLVVCGVAWYIWSGKI